MMYEYLEQYTNNGLSLAHMSEIQPSAIGSDVSRSFKQHFARSLGSFFVKLFRLNHSGYFATEFVQQIDPVCTIQTRCGPMYCRGGHGRLRWRAETFYSEEPETITWLDKIPPQSVLWDIGANVGLYSIYAALCSKCTVYSFEPEAQNFALFIQNIALNGVQDRVHASNVAVCKGFGLGKLLLHDLTKGGAYNQFSLSTPKAVLPSSSSAAPIMQLQMGASVDELVKQFQLPSPTHVKIDVDGIEPEIIFGALNVLGQQSCRSVLIEVQETNEEHQEIIEKLKSLGFQCTSQRSNWESRSNREREHEYAASNMIFTR